MKTCIILRGAIHNQKVEATQMLNNVWHRSSLYFGQIKNKCWCTLQHR